MVSFGCGYAALCSPGMKKKPTAEVEETAELFLGKEKKQVILWIWTPIFFRSFGDRDKRMNEEETEGAEIVL